MLACLFKDSVGVCIGLFLKCGTAVLYSQRVSPHGVEVSASVEVQSVEVLGCSVRVKKPYLPPTQGPRTRSQLGPKLILFHTLTHSIYTAVECGRDSDRLKD